MRLMLSYDHIAFQAEGQPVWIRKLESLVRKFPTPSEGEVQIVLWGWGAPAPECEQNGARAPQPHELFRLGLRP
jgi:hypothetical protein